MEWSPPTGTTYGGSSPNGTNGKATEEPSGSVIETS